MQTKPQINHQEIIQCLQHAYGLKVSEIYFLPLGNDFNTTVYHITTNDKKEYFLKLRSGDFCQASAIIPKLLNEFGIKHIISPLTTKPGQVWIKLNSVTAILYPYISGHTGVEGKLSDQQWLQLGSTIKNLHSADIPKSIRNIVPKETFSLMWCQVVTKFLEKIENKIFEENILSEVAVFLQSKNKIILNLLQIAKELCILLQSQRIEYVLCHADIHGWNLLIDKKNDLYLLDWDTVILAPKERDLMFVGAGIWNSGYIPTEEEYLFYKGYGKTNVNSDAICYYRTMRIIQDIGEYCQQIFLSNTDDKNRVKLFEYLQANFLPNGTISRINESDK